MFCGKFTKKKKRYRHTGKTSIVHFIEAILVTQEHPQMCLVSQKQQRGIPEAFINYPNELNGFRGCKRCWQRDSKVQSNFHSQLLKSYQNVDSPRFIWCPILHEYIFESLMTTMHIILYKHGQGTMDLIFGKIRPKRALSKQWTDICSAIEKNSTLG